jgi:sodium transport system permease protein
MTTRQMVGLLYLRELRSAMREPSIVRNGILMPILLYPLLLWLIFSAIAFARGQEQSFVSRVVVAGDPIAVARLAAEIDDPEQFVQVDSLGEASDRQSIVDGDLDLVVHARNAALSAPGLENFEVELIYDSTKDRSSTAHRRLLDHLDTYRESNLRQLAKKAGVKAPTWQQFAVKTSNTSTDKEMGAFLLGLVAPLIMVMMIAVGCFFPAVDTTAGERERSTWETLLGVAAPRHAILLAKYLYVATMGVVAGLLNLLAMSSAMPLILAPLLRQEGETLEIAMPLAGLPLMIIAAILLALFIAALMLLFAAFARTFKEGQSMVGPVYMFCLVPPLLLSSPDLELTLSWALVPIANVTLLFRQAISGVFHWPAIGLTLLVEAVVVWASLVLARKVLSFEDVLVGSYGGHLGRFVKEKLLGKGKKSS